MYTQLFFSTYLQKGRSKMLNNNHVADIRTCQRIKFDQALYILTMYEKKIRSQVQFNDSNDIIDAQKQYDEKIVRSWNNKWKMDLTKPLLNCVTSVSPRILLDIASGQSQRQEMDEEKISGEQQENSNLNHYNQTMLQFIRRMRAQHEDQSNFKLTEVDVNQQRFQNKRLMRLSQQSLNDFLNTIEALLSSMIKSFQNNAKLINQEMEEGDHYFLSIGSRLEELLELLRSTKNMEKGVKFQMLKFISSNVAIFDAIRESEQGSTLVTIQPKLNQFTYILHPLFFPIYASYLKQLQQSKSKAKPQQKQGDQNPFKSFFSSNTSSLSKVVFINLDGYQSQFNLQFARCFKKNMLYISFPKQDIHYANDQNYVYEQRLYKKIMYNWQKIKMSFNANNPSDDEQLYEADKKYFLNFNIEDYYTNVQKILYNFNSGFEDLNNNMFVFPLRLPTLNQNFNNLIPEDQYDTIQVYESTIILQIFKYFLINQIKQFGPTYIVVSHSGRLNIEDSHFVQIMQQLTKLCHYKVVYFPNLTTRFCPESKNGVDHQLDIRQIDYLKRDGAQKQQVSYDFFNKIARFLKVSSGTYSLVKNFEQKGLLTKHTNLKVLKKVNKLMQVLGNQYENIQRIRFKNSQIQLIPKLYEKDAQKITKVFEKLVPSFYNELYLLIQSLLSVCHLPEIDQKAVAILLKYNYNPKQVKYSYVFRELKQFLATKSVSRNCKNEKQKIYLIYEKMKKYLQCQRQKHFLEISQQKYEDSILLHFKNSSNIELFDSTTEGKPNLTGLIDVSFSSPNKQSKDCLHIFDSTQVLYKLDRTQTSGPIPILIMNHLPLDRKNVSKFDNYCAFLSKDILKRLSTIKTAEQGTQKIHEQKKIKLYPIRLFGQQEKQIIQPRFCFRTQWNYCETQNYLILFWPQLFDFVQAVSCRIQGKNYEPQILNEFYMAKKQFKNDGVYFHLNGSPEDLAPRTGCSTYQYRDSIYILGGFYDRTNNYLSLQRDVTMIDMSTYVHQGQRKLNIVNLKSQLYEPITKMNQEEQKRTNSYIRPRREFQFFDKSDIFADYQPEQGIKSVIMIGGVGQNFIHPFSLITYYYYELKINEESRRLQSIKRNIVYNKSIPVNVSRPSKNMGIIKTPIRNKNQGNGKTINVKPQLTQPNSYARFRIVYKMQQNDLRYKFQYIFSEKDCKMLKDEFKKFNDEKNQICDLSDVRVEKIPGNNHCFSIEKHGLKQIVHLRLQYTDGPSQFKDQQFKLTHESVIFLSVIGTSYVCALIKHPVFTNDKTILADCLVKIPENFNSSDQEVLYVNLRPFQHQLEGDLTLHIIQASNANLIYILHGHRLYNSTKIHEYLITNSKVKKTKVISKISAKKPIPYLQQKSIPKCCYSTFFYRTQSNEQNDIICESYLAFEEDGNVITKISQCFNPTDSNLAWVYREPIVRYVFCLQNSNNAISLVRLNFLEFYKSQTKGKAFKIQYKQAKYIAKFPSQQNQIMGEQIRIQLIPQAEQLNQRLEEDYQKGSILVKKPQFYEDRGYDMSQ